MTTMRERSQQINIEYWEGRRTMSEHVMVAQLCAQYALLEKMAREVIEEAEAVGASANDFALMPMSSISALGKHIGR